MGKHRYTIIEADGWGDIDDESDDSMYAVYDLLTESIAVLEGSECTNLTQGQAAMVIARLEGYP